MARGDIYCRNDYTVMTEMTSYYICLKCGLEHQKPDGAGIEFGKKLDSDRAKMQTPKQRKLKLK